MREQQKYNKLWRKWVDMEEHGPMSRHHRRLIINLASSINFQSVCDVGCGRGLLLDGMRKKFGNRSYFGSDISDEILMVAKKQFPKFEFFVQDLTKFMRTNRKFDLVICSEVLEHIKDDNRAIANLYKLSSRYLIITTPGGRMRSFERHVGHVRNYSSQSLEKKLKRAGFKVVLSSMWGFPFYSPLYRDIFEILNLRGQRLSNGNFNLFKRLISKLIYYLFFLNLPNKGDQLVILAKK